MTFETLDVKIDTRGVAYLTLNRPEKRNALSATMIDELTTFAKTIGADTATRAVVLSGAGTVFCAGGDLDWMKAQINADRETRMREARKLAMMLHALNEMPTPLIGRVHGVAMGGGVGLACVCDVVIAAQDTKFGLTETRLGLIPATIGPYVLARLGEGNARRIFASARIFGTDEAEKIGLVAGFASASALDAMIEADVAPYLQVAPNAVSAAKKLARQLSMPITASVIDHSINALADIWESQEAKDGIEAFLNKTKPAWQM